MTSGCIGRYLAFAVAGCLFSFGPAIAQMAAVPGTRVSLAPPEGFSAAGEFPGFQRADLQASIAISELPGPAATMKSGMTKATLATRGMTLISSSHETVDGTDALLIHVAQKAGGADFLKWMLVAGDQNRTVMIVGTFPRSVETELSEPIRTSLLSAAWSERRSDRFEGLLFRVSPTAKLKIAGRVSNMLMLNESGTMGPSGPNAALFVVGNSVGSRVIDDLRSFSEGRVKQTTQTTQVRNFTGRPLKVADLDAYELTADANDAATGRPIKIYQVIIPDGSRYFIMQGLIISSRAEELLPEFRRVTATFQVLNR